MGVRSRQNLDEIMEPQRQFGVSGIAEINTKCFNKAADSAAKKITPETANSQWGHQGVWDWFVPLLIPAQGARRGGWTGVRGLMTKGQLQN